jgi:hypothetical protein
MGIADEEEAHIVLLAKVDHFACGFVAQITDAMLSSQPPIRGGTSHVAFVKSAIEAKQVHAYIPKPLTTNGQISYN